MKERLKLASVMALSCIALSATPHRQQSVFRTDTEAITVDVSVRQKNTPVSGLTADDFALTDNAAAQRVAVFSPMDLPLDVTVIFGEDVRSANFEADRFDGNLKRLLSWLHPTDKLCVMSAATEVQELVPLTRVQDLAAPHAIDNLHLGGARAHQTMWDVDADPLRLFSSRDAMFLALARPAQAGRRRIIVAYTGGLDPENVKGSILGQAIMKRILERADGPVYMLNAPQTMYHDQRGLAQGVVGGPQFESILADFASLAALTGGDSRSTKDNVGAFKSIIENYRQSYVLQYTATGVPATGWHTIEVKVPKCPTCEVLARKGYAGQ